MRRPFCRQRRSTTGPFESNRTTPHQLSGTLLGSEIRCQLTLLVVCGIVATGTPGVTLNQAQQPNSTGPTRATNRKTGWKFPISEGFQGSLDHPLRNKLLRGYGSSPEGFSLSAHIHSFFHDCDFSSLPFFKGIHRDRNPSPSTPA